MSSSRKLYTIDGAHTSFPLVCCVRSRGARRRLVRSQHLHQAFHDFAPELLYYVAGADPYREDQLGGLALTMAGLARRDALVFDYARRNGVPVAIALAGGYARRVADTVDIHVGTIIAARDAAQQGANRMKSQAK